MQRFLQWLGNRLFPSRSEQELRETNARVRVARRGAGPREATRPPTAERPRPNAPRPAGEPELVDFETGLDGHIEDAGPGKNVLVRNKYLREDTGTHETLKILDDSVEDGDDTSFDPYNTGQFDRSKNWKRWNHRK